MSPFSLLAIGCISTGTDGAAGGPFDTGEAIAAGFEDEARGVFPPSRGVLLGPRAVFGAGSGALLRLVSAPLCVFFELLGDAGLGDGSPWEEPRGDASFIPFGDDGLIGVVIVFDPDRSVDFLRAEADGASSGVGADSTVDSGEGGATKGEEVGLGVSPE